MARVLFISADPFGALMAGPAVRCRELAAACAAAGIGVDIAVPGGTEHMPPGCHAVAYDPHDATALTAPAANAAAIVVQGLSVARFPGIVETGVPLAVDLYCPFLIENLERYRNTNTPAEPEAVAATYLNDLRALNTALTYGDFFLCADERQRDYWLGALTALHRLEPSAYAADPQLLNLIATVPFGCPATAPDRGEPVMRGVVRGIAEDAQILLWGGSLSPWFDLETLVTAMAGVRERVPQATLVFLGAQHPNVDVPESPAVDAARSQARSLGLLDAGVHFLPWIPYSARGHYLTEATLGVSTQHSHLETHLAFRTRILDYAWAGLPMVLTRGDALSDVCTAEGAALGVPPGDAAALRDALVRGLDDEAWRRDAQRACSGLAARFAWSTVAEPLIAWLRAPRRTAVSSGAGPAVVPPLGGTADSATPDEIAQLRAEAARARELDARLRAVDWKLRALERVPGLGALLKKRRAR